MRQKMSLSSRRELLKRVAPRYQISSWKEKRLVLDQFVSGAGYDRKYAVRRLNQGIHVEPSRKRMPPHPHASSSQRQHLRSLSLQRQASNCNVLLLHDLRVMGRTISAKFLHSADSVGKKVSRALDITCLKLVTTWVGRQRPSYLPSSGRKDSGGSILHPESRAFSAPHRTNARFSSEKLFRSIGANDGDKTRCRRRKLRWNSRFLRGHRCGEGA